MFGIKIPDPGLLLTPGGPLADYLAGIYLRLGLDVTFKGHCLRDKANPNCNGEVKLDAHGGGGLELNVGPDWLVELVVGGYTKIGGEAILYGAPRASPQGVAFEGKIIWDGIKIKVTINTFLNVFHAHKEWEAVSPRELYRWPPSGDAFIVKF